MNVSNVGRWQELFDSPLFGSSRLEKNYFIKSFKQVKSHGEVCCQVADLFAGISVFSANSYAKFSTCKAQTDDQFDLFADDEKLEMTNSEKERFPVLDRFVQLCKHQKLGVSFETHQRLKTLNPNNPLNFWWYEPQHIQDKAPVR